MMKIPPLDLTRQYAQIREEVDSAMRNICEDQAFILGPVVEQFEKNIAVYCGTKHAVGVSSGTDAIQLALMACGVTYGDEIITTPFTFIGTAEPIVLVGARPVFVDIDPYTFNIDPSLIEAKITARTKAIIVVHLYGQTVDMEPICALAKKHGLYVIEDAAQAIGAVYGKSGKKAGAMGDIGCFSFFPSKNLGGFGDGGLVTTDNDQVAEKIKNLRVHGSDRRYYHDSIGMNGRLDALQAAVLDIKLRYLPEWLRKRVIRADEYTRLINGKGLADVVTVPYVAGDNIHTYHQYTFKVTEKRDALVSFLQQHGIGAGIYYPVPLDAQACFRYLGYKKGDFPMSDLCTEQVFSLPIFPEITDTEQEYIIRTIKDFFCS